MVETMKNVVHLLDAYRGESLYLVIYLLAVISLLFTEKEKNKRILFLYLSLSVIFLFVFPLSAYVLMNVVMDHEIYYRQLWMLNAAATIGYAIIRGMLSLPRVWQKVLLGMGAAGVIVTLGNNVYKTNYTKAENVYHLPQSVIEVCDVIVDNNVDYSVRAAVPLTLIEFVRQYEAGFVTVYGREVILDTWHVGNELYDALSEEVLDAEKIFTLALSDGVECVVVYNFREMVGDPENYGYYLDTRLEGYDIYFLKWMSEYRNSQNAERIAKELKADAEEIAGPVIVEDEESTETIANSDAVTAQVSETEQVSEIAQSYPLVFRDVYGVEYEVEISPLVGKHSYEDARFMHDGYNLFYEDENYTSRLGIDVSSFQKNIDWEAVRDAGYEFAIIRCGFRGYGQAGNIKEDSEFRSSIEGALAAGLDVGVYFFAQAINEAEAIEEAQFVLSMIDGYEVELPVVYDPESILDDVARTDDVTCEQFTANSVAFCETIRDAGFTPMVYSNMLWEAYNLNMEALEEFDIWYADYEEFPQTPYRFSFWQYTNTGRVPGVPGEVDIDIEFIEK